METSKFTVKIMKDLGIKNPGAYLTIARLIATSEEFKSGQLPDETAFKAFIQEGYILGDGTKSWLDIFGKFRNSNNRVAKLPEFNDRAGLFTEWQEYRRTQLKPKDVGYMDLLRSGEKNVLPAELVVMSGDLPEWGKGIRTVTTNLGKNKSLRLAYDNEDVTPMLALKAMQLVGYKLPAKVTNGMQAYGNTYTKDKGVTFFDRALQLTKYIEYDPNVELDTVKINNLVNRYHCNTPELN